MIRFRSESDPPPETIETATDRTTAVEALRILRDGTHLVYRGDEKSVRQLFAALKRPVAKKWNKLSDDPGITQLFPFAQQKLIAHVPEIPAPFGGVLADYEVCRDRLIPVIDRIVNEIVEGHLLEGVTERCGEVRLRRNPVGAG